MIRINLLPYRSAQRVRKLNAILIAWAATFALGLLLVFGVDLLILDELDTLTTTQRNNDQTIQELNEQLGEIKDINDRKALALTRLEIINRLSNEQTITIHMLDELTRTIPEQVWLTRLETQKNVLLLTGLATSNAVVADFMRLLTTSPYFADIELSKVIQQEQKDQKEHKDKLKSFALNLKFAMPKPSTPAATPTPDGKKAGSTPGK
ncbi:MAG: PilN domain-containing protein [Magnetococcus sp. DMHC-8]